MKRIKSLWMKLTPLNRLYYSALLSVFVQFAVLRIGLAPDSQSYIDAWTNNFGILDYTRTPVYPIVLGIIGILLKGYLFLYGLFLFQIFFFILSVKWFYRLTESILSKQKLAYVVSFFYAVHPCVNSWCFAVLTESLSISLMVGFLYYFHNNLIRFSVRNTLTSVIFVFLMVFLRPAFIYLLPSALVAFLLMLLKSKKYFVGVFSILFVCIFVIGYMQAFNNRYGAFTTSRIGTANQYYSARQYGYIRPTIKSSTEFKRYLEKSIAKYGECPNNYDSLGIEAHQASILFPLNEINYAIYETSKIYPERLFTSICRRTLEAARSPLFECSNIRLGYLSTVFGPSIGTLLFFLFFFIYYCVYQVACMKSIQNFPYMSMLIIMIIIGNFLVSSVGSYQCYGRLFISSVPCALILFAQLYQMICKERLLA